MINLSKITLNIQEFRRYFISKMTLSIQAKYFFIAIIGVGSIGIWLPFLLALPLGKSIPPDSIPINLTTFYVSIYFGGCVDFMLKQIDDIENSNRKSTILNILALILLSFALIITTVWLSINDYITVSILLSLIGVFIALRLWWINNTENPNFDEKIRVEAEKKHGNSW